MKSSSILLIGSGGMAKCYAKVLNSLNKSFVVVGRGRKNAKKFEKDTGLKVVTGGINNFLIKNNFFKTAIIAVGIDQLGNVCKELIRFKIKNILVEKPGSISLKDIKEIHTMAKSNNVKIFVAYNRRFYNSIQLLKSKINKDGGISSINFNFTEFSAKVKNLKKNNKIKKKWVIANSSHVIDLAFYLAGKPKKWNAYYGGKNKLSWHPASSKFCGTGITTKKIIFSYFADWQSTGNWEVNIMTLKNRYILNPLEKLQFQSPNRKILKTINSTNTYDKNFKPGIFLQTKNFLNKNYSSLCSLSNQIENMKIYYKIAGYAK